MMNIIVVDDDDVDCEMVETSISNPKKPDEKISFQKKLIAHVRKHRLLYDNKHKLFSNVAKKEMVWQKIAKKLNLDVDMCKNTWIEIRYSYQCHARRLRKYFRNGQQPIRKRPSMPCEEELMFLWRLIENRKSCSLPFEIENPSSKENEVNEIIENIQFGTEDLANQVIDDDLILVEEPVECIVIDEEEDNGKTEKQFKVTSGMKLLIEQIKKYPELYDTQNLRYNDYTSKSLVWNGIASTLGDKATKLMKCWIIMQTRYEWELNQVSSTNKDNVPPTSNLQRLLEFLKTYILKNPNTVYKQSYYLKSDWHEPIDYFKEIYSLIVRMKVHYDIVNITDALLRTPEKSTQYKKMWGEFAFLKGTTAGQCETTWLIMRHFYWELMYMRKESYQLTDKWYFETVITELYEIAKKSQLAQQNAQQPVDVEQQIAKEIITSRFEPKTYETLRPNKPSNPSIRTSTQIQPTIINNLPAHMMVPQQSPLPKITGAISLAPQAFTGAPLQIRPVTVPEQPQILNGSMLYNIPLQNNVTLTYSTGPTIRSPAPATIVQTAPPTIRNTTPTLARNLAPTSTMGTTGPRPSTLLNTNTTNTTVAPPTTYSTAANSKTIMTQKNAAPIISSQMEINSPLANAPNPVAPSLTNNEESVNVVATPQMLPKITGAVSLLNYNEILIELIASQNGNNLVVHGPPLSEKYQLSMPTVAKFIRQILAIPLLHNKRHNQPNLINSYWDHISKNFNLPPHICRACWNFLVQNFAHFPQIAPLKDLMAPFKTTLQVWKSSVSLFKVFDDHCVSMGWLKHMDRLPEVVECISTYPILYTNVLKDTVVVSQPDMESVCAWRTIRLRFPKIDDIQDIWTAIKNCFCQYMSDLEYGIDNKWPINWWRAFARLKFLVETRYDTNEPFYYIVSNKMLEEIERCAMQEMKTRYDKTDLTLETNDCSKLEDFELHIPTVELHHQPTTSTSASESTESANSYKRGQIETVALLTAVQKYPAIYGKADNVVKYEAWEKVAKELNMSTTDCILAFQNATKKYCAYRKQDSVSRCRLNEKYYKKFNDIFRGCTANKKPNQCKLNIKTPSQLNQSWDPDELASNSNSSSELIFPERYISDINMSNSPSNLVVKNWVFALCNIPLDGKFHVKLRNIIDHYVPNNQ